MFDGVVHEVAWGLAFEDRIPFQSPVAIEGFRLGELGLGHIAMLVSDMEQSDRFITQILGHKVTGHMFVGPTEVRFYRCSARHHSIGIVQDPSPPRRVQHIQIEYNSMDDLGRALDRAAQLPMPVIVPIGKHNADWVISFYVRSPSGVAIELAHGGRLMREDEPTELEIFSGSVWGHRTGMDKL
jgi:catechol 2,3-dioxygenase-like lactoylglutathione lyase family enzyme